MTKPAPAFEHHPCTRCGGCGTYSYCQRFGHTCFKCVGSGWNLTSRGAAAQAHYTAALSRRIADLKAGDKVRLESFGVIRWYTVQEIKASSTPGQVALLCDGMSYHTSPETVVRFAHSVEQKQAALADALAYQATLTKAGKPRKNRKAQELAA